MTKQNKQYVIAAPIPDWQNDHDRATLNTIPKFIKCSVMSGMELLSILNKTWSGWYKLG